LRPTHTPGKLVPQWGNISQNLGGHHGAVLQQLGVVFGSNVRDSDANGGAQSWHDIVQKEAFILWGHANSLGWG
jgi:anaerobic selenocysteine-containing dehydrogenase